jgi:uncharacterized protein YidB (DUF937 family)
MGLLDQVIGGMLGPQSTGGGNAAIADVLTELLAPQQQRPGAGAAPQPGGQTAGGLGGLLDTLTRSGQGDIADSWVGTGENLPVAPDQLGQALDRDTIENLARRSGLSRDELLRQLSEHLPKAVDRLTRKGRRPSPEDMGHW